MNEDQREAILDNAKYLRQVRPLDPEELREYVSGSPDAESIRQVLRAEATTLGLLEREDGRFEPVSDGPIDVTVDEDGVTQLPDHLERAVESILVDRFGPGWPDGESGQRLRTVIRDFKRRYHRGETVSYDEQTALGYLVYHLPSYFAAIQYIVGDLAGDDLVPAHLRVLDVGAGVGGPALGLSQLLGPDALVEYHAVEPSPAAAILETLLAETGRNVHPTVHRQPIESFDPSAEDIVGEETQFDLVLFANVLSELDAPAQQVSRALSWLDSDGSLVALSPADRNTAISLRKTERTVESETNAAIYAPTVRLWPHEQPTSESWSFDRKPALESPAFQRKLDEGERTPEEQRGPDSHHSRDSGETEATAGTGDIEDADGGHAGRGQSGSVREPGDGEFVNVDVQYAYSILRLDGRRALDFWASSARSAKLADSEAHVTDRIDCVAVKLSHDLAETGNPLYLVGDGSQQRDHFAVLANESSFNRDLPAADYGDLLRFENVLVLWNEDEQAFNLVVDDETFIDRIPA